MVTTLQAVYGCLYLGDNILLRRYGMDCDTIHWPFGSSGLPAFPPERDRENLACALFDEFEMGYLKERTVVLPDGTAFNIDDNMPRR